MSALFVTAHLIAALNQHPTVFLGAEEPTPEEPPILGPIRTGRATRYGDSLFIGRPLGCGGAYRSGDPSILAVPVSRYREWPCGTPLLVTGPYGSLVGRRQDSCPGCDAYGILLDMGDTGHAIVCGPGTCTVTVQEVLSGGWRGWRELAL